MSRRRERGFALLGAVVALSALALVATTPRDRGRAWTAAAPPTRSNRCRPTRWPARRSPPPRSCSASRRSSTSPTRRARRGPDRSPARQIGPGWVEVTVEDEARRLDLNAPGIEVPLRSPAPPPRARPGRRRRARRLDRSRRRRAAARRRAGLVSPPRAAARAAERPARAASASSRLLRGAEPAPSSACARSSRSRASRALNPNTAPPEVLEAWLDDPQRAGDILAQRAQGVVTCDDLPPCTTRGQHYLVRATVGVGRVRRRVEAIVWPSGSEPRVTGWRQLEP